MAVKSKLPAQPPEPTVELPREVTVGYGCTLVDPFTKEAYSTFPKRLVQSPWTDVQLQLGNLIEVMR